MREIKFRAWANNQKKMYYDGFTVNSKGGIASTFGIYEHNLTLMQYTGLKDKNGVEIYEGDILDFGMGNKGRVEHSIVNSWCVEYNLIDNPNINRNYQWDDSNKVVQLWKLCQDNRAEVIGNIYENPELLEDSRAMSPPVPVSESSPDSAEE